VQLLVFLLMSHGTIMQPFHTAAAIADVVGD